jgi:hypothetical protein
MFHTSLERFSKVVQGIQFEKPATTGRTETGVRSEKERTDSSYSK